MKQDSSVFPATQDESVTHHTEAAMEAAEEIVGPYQGTVECPWCSKHPHLDPCTFECASARKEKQEHDRAIANSAAIISKHLPSVSVEARARAAQIMQDVNLHAFSDVTYDQLRNRISAALTDREQSIWKKAIAISKNPRLKSGLWSGREDEVAECIQQRVAVALECASRGENYRNSLEAMRKAESFEQETGK